MHKEFQWEYQMPGEEDQQLIVLYQDITKQKFVYLFFFCLSFSSYFIIS